MRLIRNILSNYIFLLIIFIQILVFTACDREQSNKSIDDASKQQITLVEHNQNKKPALDEQAKGLLAERNTDNPNKNKLKNLMKDIKEVQLKVNGIKKNKNYETQYNNGINSIVENNQMLKEYLESTEKELQLKELQLIDEINDMLEKIENYRGNKN